MRMAGSDEKSAPKGEKYALTLPPNVTKEESPT
jgi:hypothetical protein